MTNTHLTDETLQAFLLKELQDDTIANHLTACSECQKRLAEYHYLIEGVQNIKAETFSFDVTSVVMEKIVETEIQKEKKTYTALYASLFIIAIIISIFLYPYIKIIFSQLKASSIMTNAFILVSALGIAAFLLNDAFRQYKQKEILLLK
ncbi:MAG: hypothetical protein QM534_07170 [Sediminibacterium sp.]|nr:hypothetical protein [Sediminibacterium sp.]